MKIEKRAAAAVTGFPSFGVNR